MQVQRKGKGCAQPKKKGSKGACSRGGGVQQEESNVQSSSNNYLSDDDESLEMTSCSNVSSASKKTSSSRGGAKARAGRGAATDPQSLYARVRRTATAEIKCAIAVLSPSLGIYECEIIVLNFGEAET